MTEQQAAAFQELFENNRRSLIKITGAVIALIIVCAVATYAWTGVALLWFWLAFLGVCLFPMLVWIARSGPKRSRLARLSLEEVVTQVVWIHASITRVQLGPEAAQPSLWRVSHIHLCFANGRGVALAVPKGSRDRLLATLGACLPQASLGYSDDILEQFLVRPASLRCDALAAVSAPMRHQ